MTAFRSLVFLALSGSLWAQASGCLAVEGDRVLAADMSAAWPEFAAVPAETSLCFAPAAGARRVFKAAELGRLAQRYKVAQPSVSEVCFERSMQQLTREDLASAMKQQPGLAGAHIEIEEFSQASVPKGEIVFPLATLPHPAHAEENSPVLWRGFVSHGSGRKTPVWAKARISVACKRIVAVEPLTPGRPVEASQLRLEEWQGFPLRDEMPGSVEQISGRLPKHTIPQGAPVTADLLQDAWEVERGESVHIEVHSGAARLSFVARAETPGRRGDVISIRNLKSGRLFSARVESKGKAIVDAGTAGEKPL
ncbi:MAG: flagellar basal body P-ring formation chaperone FlgA [Bryobacteraceae bacterium]